MPSAKSGEFRGKTVEAAIGAGLSALGLMREEVDIQIVRPGSRGLLGIGAEDAVVRLTAAQPAAPAGKPETAQDTRPEPTSRQARPAPAPVASAPAVTGAASGAGMPPARQAAAAGTAAANPTGAGTTSAGSPGTRTGGAPRGARQTRQAEPGTRERGAARQPSRPAPASPPAASPAAANDVAATEDEDALKGREVLAALLERMNVQAAVELIPPKDDDPDADERSLVLNIVGDDLGVLIGRQAEVLSALQFLVRLMVNQESHSRTSLVVDVNGYKAKRAESLRKLAIRTADQVSQTGRTMALEPMTPAERRIVHLALREHSKVTTLSVGEGTRRKVTVVPKK